MTKRIKVIIPPEQHPAVVDSLGYIMGSRKHKPRKKVYVPWPIIYIATGVLFGMAIIQIITGG